MFGNSMNLSIKILAEADKAVKELGQVSQGVSGINDKLDALKEKGKFWGHISVGFIALRETMQAVSGEFQQLVRVADDYANMNAKLKLATGAQQEFNTAYQQLFRIAQQTAVPLGETVQLYTRLAPGLKQLGATQAELLAVTELTGKALALSGANAGEAAASMTQFAQALGSGKLRGDEFNSLMEQAPRLMKAVADGMGQPIGRLREMAEAGELSADRVVKALFSQKEVMEREFAHLPLTVGRAWQQLENQFARLVGETDAQTGSTRRLAEAIQTLADNLSGLVGTLELVVKLGGALLAFNLVAKLTAWAEATTLFAGAMAWLRTQVAAVFLLVKTEGVWALLTTDLYATAGAATTTATAIGLVGKALKGVIIAYAGYEIGKYVYEQFLQVRLASVAMIDVLQRGWEYVKYGAIVAWEGVKAVIAGTINWIKEKWSDMIALAAKGLRLVGMDQTAAKMDAYAKSLLPGKQALAEFTAALEAAKKKHKQALADIKKQNDAVVDEMIREENRRKRQLAPPPKANGDSIVSPPGAVRGEKVAYTYGDDMGLITYDDRLKKYDQAQAHYRKRNLSAEEYNRLQQELLEKYFKPELEALKEAERLEAARVSSLAQWLSDEQASYQQMADDLARANAQVGEHLDRMAEIAFMQSLDTDLLSASREEREVINALMRIELAHEDALIRLRREGVALSDAQLAAMRAATEQAKQGTEAALRAQAAQAATDRTLKSATKQAEAHWERTAADIEKSLTDALMRGFEGGKGFAENFRDTLVNQFNSLVLRPLVELGVKQGTSALSSFLSGGSAGTATGGTQAAQAMGGLSGSFTQALDAFGAKYFNTANNANFVGPPRPGQLGGAATLSNLAGAGMATFAIGQSVQGATGSRAAGALAGAMSGAMLGFQMYGPTGAVVGALAGLVLGGLGGGGGEVGNNHNTAEARVLRGDAPITVQDTGGSSNGSNVGNARKVAESYLAMQEQLQLLTGSNKVSAYFAISSKEKNAYDVGGSGPLTWDYADIEGMLLDAMKRSIKGQGINGDVKKALMSLNGSQDLDRLAEVVQFAKDYRFTRNAMAGAQDVKTAQLYDLRTEARAAGEAFRQSLMQFQAEAKKLGLDTTGLWADMTARVKAELGLISGEELTGMALEMARVKANTQALRETLAGLGYSVAKQDALIAKGIAAQQQALRKDFMGDITQALLELEDADRAAIKALKEEQALRLADAKALGLTAEQLAMVNKLNAEQIKALKDQHSAWKDGAGDNLKGWLAGQALSDLSSLSPTGKFTAAQAQFSGLLAAARKGDEDALAGITGSADALLAAGRDLYASGTQYTALEQMTRTQLLNLGAKLDLPGVTGGEQKKAAETQIRHLENMVMQLEALIRQNGAGATATNARLEKMIKQLGHLATRTRLEAAA